MIHKIVRMIREYLMTRKLRKLGWEFFEDCFRFRLEDGTEVVLVDFGSLDTWNELVSPQIDAPVLATLIDEHEHTMDVEWFNTLDEAVQVNVRSWNQILGEW